MNNIKKILFLIILGLKMICLTSCTQNSEIKDNNIINDFEIKEKKDDNITITILNKETITIEKNRIIDDIYGTNQLNSRWSLSEIDAILNSLKGTWKIEKYIGFVDSSLYYPDLFDEQDNLEQDKKEKLFEEYNKKVKNAQNTIPEIYISIKEINGKDTDCNDIFVNNNYQSPISIILSIDRINENYPVFINQTTLSPDFFVEYPTLYIKFFIKIIDEDKTEKYEPATLVVSSDNKFLILLDGAFYSLKKK